MAIHTGQKNGSFMNVSAVLSIRCFVCKHVWCDLEEKETERERTRDMETWTEREESKQFLLIRLIKPLPPESVRFTFCNMAGSSIDLCCSGVLTVKKAAPVCTQHCSYCQRTLGRYHWLTLGENKSKHVGLQWRWRRFWFSYKLRRGYHKTRLLFMQVARLIGRYEIFVFINEEGVELPPSLTVWISWPFLSGDILSNIWQPTDSDCYHCFLITKVVDQTW